MLISEGKQELETVVPRYRRFTVTKRTLIVRSALRRQDGEKFGQVSFEQSSVPVSASAFTGCTGSSAARDGLAMKSKIPMALKPCFIFAPD